MRRLLLHSVGRVTSRGRLVHLIARGEVGPLSTPRLWYPRSSRITSQRQLGRNRRRTIPLLRIRWGRSSENPKLMTLRVSVPCIRLIS